MRNLRNSIRTWWHFRVKRKHIKPFEMTPERSSLLQQVIAKHEAGE